MCDYSSPDESSDFSSRLRLSFDAFRARTPKPLAGGLPVPGGEFLKLIDDRRRARANASLQEDPANAGLIVSFNDSGHAYYKQTHVSAPPSSGAL